jgi:hypothetical protein
MDTMDSLLGNAAVVHAQGDLGDNKKWNDFAKGRQILQAEKYRGRQL